MADTYDTKYTSLGSTFSIDLANPSVVCITGRGTHTTVENRRGSMAVITVTMGRLLLGKVQIPYDGSQTFNLYEISPTGMKLIEAINIANHRGNVCKNYYQKFEF